LDPKLISAADQDAGYDYLGLLYRLLGNWYWFVISLSITIFLAWLNLRYAVPLYNVSGKILIQGEGAKKGVSEQFVSKQLGFETSYSLLDEIEILKSPQLMRRVVDSLQLHISYMTEGRVLTTEVPANLSSVRLKAAYPQNLSYGRQLKIVTGSNNQFTLIKTDVDTSRHSFGSPFSVEGVTFVLEKIDSFEYRPGVTMFIRIDNPDGVAASYAGGLGVSSVGESNALVLSMLSTVPDKATQAINTLIKAYDQSNIEEKSQEGKQTLRFIDDRLNFISSELYDVEKDVEQYRKGNKLPIDLNTSASEILNKVNSRDNSLAELEIRNDLLTEVANFFREESSNFRPLPFSSELLGGAMIELISAYNAKIEERKKLLVNLSEDHIGVKKTNTDLAAMRDNILLNVSSLQREFASRQKGIRKQLDPIQSEVDLLPEKDRELLQIMRQQKIKESLFLFLLQKREETALSVAARVDNSRVLEPAQTRQLVYPKVQRTYLFALLLGLVIPAGIIFILDAMNDRVYYEKDIRKRTQAPFLGIIGTSKNDSPIVVNTGSRSAIAEMFRLLRTNLQFLFPGKDKFGLLITSTTSGEGKTFVTLNLGMSFAISGKRTIIVGLDLRKPKLTEYLGQPKTGSGVTNHLVADIAYEDIVRNSGLHEHLYFIESGPLPPNPAELLMLPKMKTLMQRLRQDFDVVILDTSPVGLVADALLLGDFVDASLYVTRFGVSRQPGISIADEIYREKKLPNLGLILNGVKTSGGYGYAYGRGYYGYGYGYSAGYGYYQEKGGLLNRLWAFLRGKVRK
jgi:capsular exopolysaccharide synthesis family protein